MDSAVARRGFHDVMDAGADGAMVGGKESRIATGRQVSLDAWRRFAPACVADS
jgi:hypothetical protein